MIVLIAQEVDERKEPIEVWVAYSPKGDRLATATSDNIYIWDAENGELIAELTDLDEVIDGLDCYPVNFTPDGNGVLCSDFNGSLLFWTIDEGYQVLEICNNCSIGRVAYSPDGTQLVIGVRVEEENVALLINVISGERLLTLKGHSIPRPFASFSPDGKFLVTTTYRDLARIWDVDNGDLVWTLGDENVCDAAFSPDGSLLATGNTDRLARIWDVETRAEILNVDAYVGRYSSFGSDSEPLFEVSMVAFSPDGDRLMTTDANGNVRMWDAESGTMLFDFQIPRPSNNQINLIKVVFSTDGRHLLTQEQYGDSYILDADSGELVINLGHINSSDFNLDGRRVVIGRNDGTVSVLDLESNKELQLIEVPQ